MGSGLGCFLRTYPALVVLMLLGACAHVTPDRADPERVYDAILRDDAQDVRKWVQSGALNVNHAIPVPGYSQGAPLITVAARSASLDVLRYLIAAGANLNARTPVNETALMLASFFSDEDPARHTVSRKRHDEALSILLAAGAEIENEVYHYTPLSYAAYHGHDAAVRMLLARGARVDADAQNGGTYINTPLMMAAMQGHLSTALELLQAGANPGIRVHGGHTAAELAAKYRHPELVHVLRCAERQGPRRFTRHACHGPMGKEHRAPRNSADAPGR